MRHLPRALGVTGALLVVLGVVITATAPAQGFGWFAYAPLSEDVYTSPALPLVLSGRHLLGLAAAVTGLVLTALAVGLRLGRHRTR